MQIVVDRLNAAHSWSAMNAYRFRATQFTMHMTRQRVRTKREREIEPCNSRVDHKWSCFVPLSAGPGIRRVLNSVLQWFVCSTHESATKNKRNKSNSTKAMKNGAKQIENRRTSDKVIRRETHTFGTFNQLNEADYVLLWPLCNRQNDLSHRTVCLCVVYGISGCCCCLSPNKPPAECVSRVHFVQNHFQRNLHSSSSTVNLSF